MNKTLLAGKEQKGIYNDRINVLFNAADRDNPPFELLIDTLFLTHGHTTLERVYNQLAYDVYPAKGGGRKYILYVFYIPARFIEDVKVAIFIDLDNYTAEIISTDEARELTDLNAESNPDAFFSILSLSEKQLVFLALARIIWESAYDIAKHLLERTPYVIEVLRVINQKWCLSVAY